MKSWLIPVGIIIIILFATVSFLGNNSKSTSTSNTAKKIGEATAPTSQTEQQEDNAQKEFNVLDKIDFEKRILTVNSVQRNYVESGEYPYTPEEDQEFILVNVTIENNSNKPISFNVFDFQIENSSGVRTSFGVVGKVKDEFHSGDLAIGGKITGNIGYKVKKNEKGLKLLFKPSFLSDKEVKILLD